MAITNAGLSAKIVAKLGAAEGEAGTAKQKAFADALAGAIVEYFKDNAVVSATIPPLSIATTGSAAAQSGPAAPVSISGTLS